jgi:hypothetical protein
MPSILYLLLLLPRRWDTTLVQINILHSGVADCAGWVIACA